MVHYLVSGRTKNKERRTKNRTAERRTHEPGSSRWLPLLQRQKLTRSRVCTSELLVGRVKLIRQIVRSVEAQRRIDQLLAPLERRFNAA